MDNIISQKLASEYRCEKCNYCTLRKNDYKNHLLTAKHKKITDDYENNANLVKNTYKCDCGKEYKNRHNLSRHKKICITEKIVEAEPIPLHNGANMNIIFELIKENQEFKNMLIEQNKQTLELHKENNLLFNKLAEKETSITTINNNNNNNTTNNNNQQFNLNFFLNETCKDAMNIQEFIDNIKITFEELLTIGDAGFVNGISDIFVKRLRDLEVNKRPIHCTDSKRETFYLKETDKWNKDDKDNSKLKNAIEKIEYKNVAALQKWCNENPDSKINNSDNNLLRDKIYLQTLQGDGRTREKIVKNISKEVIIDK
jgi:predicted HAD superfamily phosphohydrolase YqeG